MSTNFYAAHRGVEYSDGIGLHIGKRSAGWDFLFRGHPDLGLTTVAAWREFLASPSRVIIDEYATPHSAEEFFDMARLRPAQRPGMRAHADEPHNRDDPAFHVDHDAGGVPFLDTEFC